MESVCSCNYCSTLYLFLSYFSSTKNIYVCASPFSLNLFISPIRSSYCMLATTEPSNSPMETGIVYSSLCPSVLLLLFAVVAFQSLFAIVFSSSVYTISCASFLSTIPILFSFHLLVLLLLHPHHCTLIALLPVLLYYVTCSTGKQEGRAHSVSHF